MRVNNKQLISPGLFPTGSRLGHAVTSVRKTIILRAFGVFKRATPNAVNGDEEENNDDVNYREFMPIAPHCL